MADQIFNVRSGFYDAVNADRVYSADDMNRPYKRVVSNGVFATPKGTPSTDLQVVASGSGMQIIVKAGEGIFADKWFENSSDINITVPSNTTTLPRIDSVIVQMDKRTSGRVGSIVYRTGTPASSAKAPSVNTVANVIEYRLANIRVNAGISLITGGMITDRRGSSECPWVTSLIYQVDTSTLYDQYAEAYAEYFEVQKTMWDDWYAHLTKELDVSMSLIRLTNTVITGIETSEIQIGISEYNKNTDILEVYINGLRAVEGIQYTVNGNTSISMTAPVEIGQSVDFVVLKSVIMGNEDDIMSVINSLEERIGSIVGGTPTVVDSISSMTDTNKIYILSTDKNWYYYSLTNSEWTAGGEYGSVTTDTTLTQSGIPADAKATGDAILDVAEDISEVREEIPFLKNSDKHTIKIASLSITGDIDTAEYTVKYHKKCTANGFVDDSRSTILIPDEGWQSVTLSGNYSVYLCDADGVILSGSFQKESGYGTTYVAHRKKTANLGYIAIYTSRESYTSYAFNTSDFPLGCLRDQADSTADAVSRYDFYGGKIQSNYTIPSFTKGSVLPNGNLSTIGSGRCIAAVLRAGTRINTENTAITYTIMGFDSYGTIYAENIQEYTLINDAVITINYNVGTWNHSEGAPNITPLACSYFLRIITDDAENKWAGKTWYSYGTSISDVGVDDTAGNNGHRGKWVLSVDAYSKMIRTNRAWGSNGIMTNSSLWQAIMSTPYDVDLVTLELGPNDSYWTVMGNVGDTGDDTFMGRLYQIYDYLTKQTRAEIVFVAVGARQFTMDTTDITPANGVWRERYRTLIDNVKKLSALFGIPVIDADANACNLNRRQYRIIMADYIHYTYLGGEIYGRYIWNQLKLLTPYPSNMSSS